MKSRVQIVCHKGANKQAPENTFAAARLCVEWGVDYVEIDVHTSADGVLYIFHGPYLQRTTNGSGWIGAFTAEEIDRLDAGSWFSPAFAGEQVPRLEEFLRWIKGKARIFFDVKNVEPQHMRDLVFATGFEHECFFWSSDAEWMRAFHAIAPEMALKVNVKTVEQARAAKAEVDARLVEVGVDDCTPDFAAACHDLNVEVMVLYAGNDPAVFRKIIQSGADLINTDYGDEFQALQRALSLP
jgi:glycerophosphoryl diester phosphodiesterase